MDNDTLTRLLEVSTTLSSTLDLRLLLGKVISAATELTETLDASILLYDERSGRLEFVASTSEIPLDAVEVPVEGSLAGWIVTNGRPVIVNAEDDGQAIADERHFAGIDQELDHVTSSLLGVPLISQEKVIGALEVLNKRGSKPYTEDDVAVLQALAAQAAVAIDNAYLFQQSDLVAEIMHELRTPLNAMSLASRLLQRDDLTSDRRSQVLATLERECRRLTRMTSDFLDLARLESGRFRLKRRPVNVTPLVESVVLMEEEHAAACDVTIETDLSRELPPISGDPDRLTQVIFNLVSNAIKYNRRGGRVTISASVHEDAVCLSVSDTGRGIRADAMEDLFKRFYRVQDGDEEGGTGLGLSIARKIVEAHGGRIDVESTVGEGSTFHCWLPRGG